MEEVSFQDWPGQPVDLNAGTNPWMPAYGLQPPSVLLDKEDFAGNPDAEYFFHGTSGQFMYLETIQEETSDDLRSDSGSRTSPVGWLATDSESGSVICIQDDVDCDSDRELACPPKRRKQDLFLSFGSEEYDEPTSLSRSSSLLQFETLEKQFQQESQSPSIYSQFSFDSLELGKKEYCLEDSSPEYEGDFFKNVVNSKQSLSRDSLLYNASTRYSGSESSDSDTIFDTSRSCDNLKTWRSFDSLPLNNGHCSAGKRFSSENLSEDSGYGDQMLCGKGGNLSNSAGNLADKRKNMTGRIGDLVKSRGKKNSYVGFNAYDCDVFQNFHGNFGVSYQDLSIFERYDPFSEPLSKSSPLTDVFLRRKQARQLLNADFSGDHRVTNSKVNLDVAVVSPRSNYNDTVVHASSAPNLCQNELVDVPDSVVDIFSVPKDLNFLGAFNKRRLSTSVAEKNWNLADILEKDHAQGDDTQAKNSESSDKTSDLIRTSEETTIPDEDMANYKREGSYSEAMRNRVDLSDDENSLVFKKKLPKSPIVDFDRRVLKAISEQSLQSLMGSTISLRGSQARLDKQEYVPPAKLGNYNVAMSTPDLNRFEPARKRDKTEFEDRERGRSNVDLRTTARLEEERSKNILLDTSNDETEVVMRRKGSIIKSSTSTSGMSDIDDKTLRNSVKSFTGSTGSKGVTFAPVVAEVNWGDDASVSTATPDRESSYSLDSSSPEPVVRSPPPQKLVKPRPRYPRPQSRRSVSQPDLSDTDAVMYKREFIDHLNKFRDDDVEISKSQPDMSKLKRRGSQLVKKDKDGCTIKAYVDADGIQYKHTQLDLKSLSQISLNDDNSTDNTAKLLNSSGAGSKNSLLQSSGKHPYHHHYYGHEQTRPAAAAHQQQPNVGTGRQSNVAKQANVARMDDEGDAIQRPTRGGAAKSTKNRAGLGGFLQRLASFRLGVKKGQEKVKRKAQSHGTTAVHSRPIANQNTTKPEYIYIPLKGPENNNVVASTNQQQPLMAKPPLPKQPPPRVVHASVKKHPSGAQAQDCGATSSGEDRRRRRTIDSGSVATAGGVDLGRRSGNASMEGPMGLIETDLDTEVTVITSGANAKARSLLDLGQEPRLQVPQKAEGQQGHSGRPHKSMEFLLDKQNLKVVEPPENELQKTERVMSEHELRVQRSLQKLTIPDWYKQSQVPGQGFLLKKNSSRETRWTGTGSKTTSLSSLGSGTQSPVILSPTPCNQPFVRWSTSKLNSTASSPCQSTRSSFNQGRQPNGSISPSSARSSFSYRQPYMGWRSQERLNRPRTPAERLASSLLAQQVHNSAQENPEIQTSIKEVTSAIVHYVSGMKPPGVDHTDNHSQRSGSVSPRGSQKLCWLESSFVGTKPLDSPETPVTCSESPVPPHGLRLDLQNYSSNDLATLSGGDTKVRPSPSSTTLEDVLDSLLGLPSSGRAPSPCLQETVSASTSPQRRLSDDASGAYRRRSEGSEPAASTVAVGSALPAPSLLRCRYSRCGKTALATSKEAEQFKSCHNCTYTYCSRACRRSHWERHRKTCLFSRMGTLCRQVIASTKEKKDVLKELSVVAKRGYISHGLGAVKCFYPNPEAVERFLSDGLPSLGELTFVRWQDLLPSEMGPMLYEELVNMCKNYNPETKFVLYVSICVVSETPASGAVKWERQLVSRCAKIKLSKDLNFTGPDREIPDTPETLILTCNPIRLPTKETTMRARVIAFDNLQTQLRYRGVSLKRQYPDIYRRLDAYCEDLALKVEAQTIYPRNPGTNKSFMCIIMLESDSETLRHVEKAGVKVKTIDVLLCSETTAL